MTGYRYLTLHWFTDFPYSTAHLMEEGGHAACSRKIFISFNQTPYWKSDMPDGISPCPACEKILAGG